MPSEATAKTVEAFIREIGRVGADDTDFSRRVDLFDYGYLDSFGIVELISRVQEAFKIDMTNVDFYGDQIRSIEAIADYIDARPSLARTSEVSS